MNYFRVCFFLSVLIALSFFLFSYTQVDLGLTLSNQSVIRNIQTSFQYIGFYQRPIATIWYVVNVISLFGLFLIILGLIQRNILTEYHLYILIVPIIGFLIFSYPAALSYDVFNYIFTAKTVLIYHVNPYVITPVHFQGVDPMLSFMRWTHLPSAYPPLWIALTVPMYILSFNSLLLTLFTFKIIPVASFILSGLFIGKILEVVDSKHKLMGIALFLFNPLIIVETMISAHNDIVMMTFALGAYYCYLRKKKTISVLLFALSVAVKLMTFTLFPLFIIGWKRSWAVFLLSIGLFIVLARREFLPWYIVWIIPFSVLRPSVKSVQIIIGLLSFGLLMRYVPVLFTGGYDQPVAFIQQGTVLASLITGILIAGIMTIYARYMHRVTQ